METAELNSPTFLTESPNLTETLKKQLHDTILFIDGAMGTMIQKAGLEEKDYQGDAFKEHSFPLKGNNDLLSITKPDLIRDIHLAYLRAGANVIETNTFNATQVAQADYGLESEVVNLNKAGAQRAREAIELFRSENPDQPAYVAGVLGPTNRTASISPDVNDPSARNMRS